jgi:hypothetical protein
MTSSDRDAGHRVPHGEPSSTQEFVSEQRPPPEDEEYDLEADPEARLYTSAELEDENGEPYVIQQQNVGPGNELGGGEWPDPHTPPRPPAPGAD